MSAPEPQGTMLSRPAAQAEGRAPGWWQRVGAAAHRTVRTAVSLAAGVLVGTLLLYFLGAQPASVFSVLWETVIASGSGRVDVVLLATPLILIGLGYALAFKAQIWMVGGEGQLHLGAVATAAVALLLPATLSPWLAVPLGLVAGLLAGTAWAMIPGLLRAYREVNEVVSTLMLNFVGIFVVEWAIRQPFRDPYNTLAQTPLFPEPYLLPQLGGSRIHLGVLLALVLVPLIYYLASSSAFGHRAGTVGANPHAARASGIPVSGTIFRLFLLSGALGGLAGAVHVLGSVHRLLHHMSANFGYVAIMVALLGRRNPIGVLFAGLFFAALMVGSEGLQVDFGIPQDFMLVFMGVLVLFMLAGDVLWKGREAR